MKTHYKIIGLSIVFGLLFWLIDTVLDFLIYYKGTFMNLLILDVPPHEVYIRLSVLFLFIIFGILMSATTAKRMRLEQAVQKEREYAEIIVETVHEALVVLDAELRVISTNRFFYQTFKIKPKEVEGKYLYDLGHREWDIPKLRELLEQILPENTAVDNFEVEHEFPSIGRRVMLLNARSIYREMNKTQMILLTIEDITKRKQAEEALRRLKEELEIEVGEKTKELQVRISELERFHEATVDRELRMKELRDKIEELESRLKENRGK